MTNNTVLYVNRRQESNWRAQGRADAIDGMPPPLHWPLQYAEGYAMYVGIRYRLYQLPAFHPCEDCMCQACIRYRATGEVEPTPWRCDGENIAVTANAYSPAAALMRVVCYVLAERAARKRFMPPTVCMDAYSDKQIEELFSDVSKVQP